MAKPRQSFPERLHELIEKHAGGVVRRFAEAIGVNHQAVHNWLEGGRQPGAKALVAIWRVFRVDPLWLLTGEAGVQGPAVLRVAPPSAPKSRTPTAVDLLEGEIERDRFIAAPVLAAAAAAASPRDIRPQDVEDFAVIYAEWALKPEMLTCARVADDAMSPILTPGAIVAIDHSRRDPKKLDGELAVFRRDGAGAVRWCKFVAPDLVMGLPENKHANGGEGLLVFKDEAARDCVIGRVAWWWGVQK
jgi:phage repressor protein C with HTH and peptisase S24 domain